MKQHQVYSRLRQAIYSGRIKPGARLVERTLAKQFNTSRVPLRESLLRLMTEGLIRRTPRRTSYVEDLTPQHVSEIWLMRETLEPVAARLTAADPRRVDFRRLRRLADQMADELHRGKERASAESDLQFHRAVVEATGSLRLLRAYDLSHVPMLMSRMAGERGDPEELRQQHQVYTTVIENGDAAAAEQYARRHVCEVANRMPRGSALEEQSIVL